MILCHLFKYPKMFLYLPVYVIGNIKFGTHLKLFFINKSVGFNIRNKFSYYYFNKIYPNKIFFDIV